MAVSDHPAGNVVATVPIGTAGDGAGYDAASGNTFALSSRNVGLDPTDHRVFLVSATFGPPPAGGRGRPLALPESFAFDDD
jgi:hypothetical protein